MSSRKKVLFIDFWSESNYLHASGSGIGSSLFKLAALADASFENYEIHLLTSPSKKELLENASGMDFIFTEISSKNLNSFHKIINLGIADDEFPEEIKILDNYHPFTQADRKKYKSSAHLSFWRAFVAEALNYPLPNRKSQIKLCTDSEEIIWADKILPKNYKWIALSYQCISPLKDYKEWDKVINDLLNSDSSIRFILLGEKHESFEESERIINMMGKTSIQKIKAIISQVDLVLGVDGLISNVAMALDKPAIILFTMISPEHVIDDLKSDHFKALITRDCPYQFCYENLTNYRSSACQYLEESKTNKIPKCLKFTPESIVKEVKKFLAD